MDILDDTFEYLDSIRIDYNRKTITDWLFEYSCQMIEKLGYDVDKNTDQIGPLMKGKLEKMIEPCTKIYWEDEFRCLELGALPYDTIPHIVNQDYEQYRTATKET